LKHLIDPAGLFEAIGAQEGGADRPVPASGAVGLWIGLHRSQEVLNRTMKNFLTLPVLVEPQQETALVEGGLGAQVGWQGADLADPVEKEQSFLVACLLLLTEGHQAVGEMELGGVLFEVIAGLPHEGAIDLGGRTELIFLAEDIALPETCQKPDISLLGVVLDNSLEEIDRLVKTGLYAALFGFGRGFKEGEGSVGRLRVGIGQFLEGELGLEDLAESLVKSGSEEEGEDLDLFRQVALGDLLDSGLGIADTLFLKLCRIRRVCPSRRLRSSEDSPESNWSSCWEIIRASSGSPSARDRSALSHRNRHARKSGRGGELESSPRSRRRLMRWKASRV